ncbi:MAG: hypothetical protein ACTSVI_10395 [Promethearchaeota archaeon]
MTQKTISLPEDVYLRLKKLKAGDEIFVQLTCKLMIIQEVESDEMPI